ncbi:MAG: M20/M25/M40 family metallo-hydrolase [Nannocystaceae bacterium]
MMRIHSSPFVLCLLLALGCNSGDDASPGEDSENGGEGKNPSDQDDDDANADDDDGESNDNGGAKSDDNDDDEEKSDDDDDDDDDNEDDDDDDDGNEDDEDEDDGPGDDDDGGPGDDDDNDDPTDDDDDADGEGDDTGGDGDADDDDDDDDDGDAPDPLDLGQQSDESELTKTIFDLQAFGTRYTPTDGDDKARDYVAERLTGYGLEVQIDDFVAGGNPSANVIGKLTGSRDPEVVFIFSAHYDSTSNEASDNAPGADDNASGVAAMLEAARILSSYSFRYSLWFVATGAEEQGSRGSAHMVGWMGTDKVDVRGVLAPDMVAYWPMKDDDSLDILGDEDSAHLVDQMADLADALGVANKKWVNHSFCYGDDHTNFQEAGLPAISPMDCVEAHNVQSSGESLPHYHRTTDTLDTLYMPFTTRVTQVMVAMFAELGEPVGGAAPR